MNNERVNDERVNEERMMAKMDLEPLREAGINCGVYFAVLLTAVVLYDVFPDWAALDCFLVLVPYLLITGFILLRRRMGRPAFPTGDPGEALVRFFLILVILAMAALLFAISNGLFRPMTLVGKLNHIGAILEAPLAEEFVFRGALLTSLNRTRLGAMTFLRTEVSVFAGAAIFSVMHFVIFLAGGYGATDALISSGSAFIASLIFGVIYVRTQNIWYGVFLHTLLSFGHWN
ncbi:MAG: CPBP family intramembrane glutamic endopeptidase [Silvibacterium sp.]